MQNFEGKKFGYLKVLSEVERIIYTWKTHTKKQRQMLVECVCGKQYRIKLKYLTSGKSKSCGCKSLELSNKDKNWKESALKWYYGRYKSGAKTRNIPFEITFRDFCEIVINSCSYCGKKDNLGEKYINSLKLQQKYANNKKIAAIDPQLYGCGVDRINSKLGYTKTNIVSCCSRCNLGKLDLSKEQFLNWIKEVYEFNFS